jgi:hypothetical protein
VGASYTPEPLVFALWYWIDLRPDEARYHRIGQDSMTPVNDAYGDLFTLTRPTFA